MTAHRHAFTVDGDPGQGRINGRAAMRRRGSHGPKFIGKSTRYERYLQHVADVTALQLGKVDRFVSGLVGVSLTIYAPTRRKLDRLPAGFDLPNLDSDSSIKAIFDGLQRGGLIDDDARIVELHVRKRYDKARPRVTILIWRVLDIAH